MIEDKIYKILESKIDVLKKTETVIKDANDLKTYDEVFDRSTLLTIYKLICDNKINTVEFPISTGKEANVFKGTTPEGNPIALKIFRTATATFKSFTKYIDGDPRFRGIRGEHRNIVYVWAQKEYKNLKRIFNAGVRVPKPITQNKNILLMEYIGDEVSAAPMLRNTEMRAPKRKFNKVINYINKMYNNAGIVHGDMSEYNILVHNGELVIIDVAQAVVLAHPMADEFLVRDVKNITRYFKKFGVEADPSRIVNEIKKA